MVGASSCSPAAVPVRTSVSTSQRARNDEVLLVPFVVGGGAGWCLTTVPLSDLRCTDPQTLTGPIFTETWNSSAPPPITEGVVLTTGQVVAVRVNDGAVIATRAESSLPYGLRAAMIEVRGREGQSEPGIDAPFPRFIPLDSMGIPISRSTRPTTPLVTWLPSRHWQRPARPGGGACQIEVTSLPRAEAQWGSVVTQVRSSFGLIGRAFLTCINTEYYVDNWPLNTWVLLDAAHPGVPPASLPAMKPVPGHPMIFNAPSADGEMVARRFGGAWLAVGGGRGLKQRLTLLEHLHATVHL